MIIELLVWAFALVLGLSIVPLLSMLAGRKGLPMGGILGRGVLWTAFMAAERVLLTYQSDGTWEATLADDEDAQQASNWRRVAGTWLGLSYEVDEDVYPVETADVELEHMTDDKIVGIDDAVGWDVRRGAQDTFVDLREAADIQVPIAEALSRLQGVGGIDESITAVAEALKEHGGDTTGLTRKWMVIANVTLLLCGFLTMIVVGT